MSAIDYMKVIDIMAHTMKLDKDVVVTNPEKEINIFDIKMTGILDVSMTCRMTLEEYHLELVFLKKNFEEIKFEKWLSNFEYELEQTFLRNIKLELHHDVLNYKIKVFF